MRYKPEHRQRTREKIILHAGRLFRRRGYEGVGIDGIMAAAKLTRGGFYGYFRSKRHLFAEVMRGAHDFNVRMKARRGTDRKTLTREAMEVVSGYLDPANRKRVGQGCTMAALSVDVARAGREVREAYGDKVRDLAAEFARGLDDPKDPDPRALASLALCVGGLVLARGVADEILSRAILSACRSAVTAQLEPIKDR